MIVEVEDQAIGEIAVIEAFLKNPGSLIHCEIEVVAKFAVVRPVDVEMNPRDEVGAHVEEMPFV